jgi:beta-galactosidase
VGIFISDYSKTLLNMSAWPYTLEDLEAAKHIHELPRRDNITLNIDHQQKGVAGINSWGARPLEKYRILKNVENRYVFRLSPYEKDIHDEYSLSIQRFS